MLDSIRGVQNVVSELMTMPHNAVSEIIHQDVQTRQKPNLKEPWSRLLDHLQNAMKDLEYAAITDNHSGIGSSTALVASFIRSALEATASLDLDLPGSLVYQLKFEIPQAMEALSLLSTEISSGILQGEMQELQVQKLLSFTPQLLNLIRNFVSAVDGCKMHPRNVFAKSASHLALFHDHFMGDVAYDAEGNLVGASITALIEEMTPHDRLVDSEFSSTFFMTFRLFSSPKEVLATLESRWNLSPPSSLSAEQIKAWKERKLHPVQYRVLNIIWQWVTRQWDPETDDEVLPALHKFLAECEASTNWSNGVSRVFRNLIEYQSKPWDSGSLVPITVPKQKVGQTPLTGSRAENGRLRRGTARRFSVSLLKRDPTQLSITDIEPNEIARQLTLIESKLFQCLKPREVLKMALGYHTPKIRAVLSFGAGLADWVVETIHNEFSIKKRIVSIKFFIKIAYSCLKLQNFASTHSILKALNSPALVPPLDLVSSEIPYRQRTQLQYLNDWNGGQNGSPSPNQLHEAVPPAVPILALYASEIIASLSDGPAYLGSPADPTKRLLNFAKYRKVAEITQDITKFQVPHSLIEPVVEIQECLYSTFKRTSYQDDTIPDQRRRSVHSSTGLKRSQSLSSAHVDSPLCHHSELIIPHAHASSIHPSVSDIATIYSIPSSRTASTNYGLFYTRHAPSQDSVVGQQWWADQGDSDALS